MNTGTFIIRKIDRQSRARFKKLAMYSGMTMTEALNLYIEMVVEGKFKLPKKE